MTGAELALLRWSLCQGSASRLAALVGVHPCTIRRNERRTGLITLYLLVRIHCNKPAWRHFYGLTWGLHVAKAKKEQHGYATAGG